MPIVKAKPHQVVMLVFETFQLLDAAGPMQVFASADVDALTSTPPGKKGQRYQLRTVSVSGGLITSSSGIALQTLPLPRPSSLKGATLLVSGGEGTEAALNDTALIRWLQSASRHTARCCSVCSGTFILAQAGLLDGRNAVTHWEYVPLFKRLFPQVNMLDDAIHVRDGSFYSSAGVTAGIDLALSLVEADLGKAVSLRVAKQLVVPLRRAGGQRQFSAELMAQCDAADGLMAQLTAWLKPRLKQAISVADMAHAACMSERTLHRHVLAHTGLSPARFLNRLRLERACTLLESGSGSGTIKRVSQQAGFESEYNLRRAFKQTLGISPGDYQSRFGGQAPQGH